MLVLGTKVRKWLRRKDLKANSWKTELGILCADSMIFENVLQ